MPKNLYISALLDVYGAVLNEKQRELCEYYYNDDLSLSEIAENEGITRQGASDLIKRSVAQLKAFEDECHYCEIFLKLKALGEEIKKSDKNKEAWTTLNEFISLWFRLCSNGDSAFNWFWEKRRV